MVVNFRAREISRGTRKLARTPTLNLTKKKSREGKLASRHPKLLGIFLYIYTHELDFF